MERDLVPDLWPGILRKCYSIPWKRAIFVNTPDAGISTTTIVQISNKIEHWSTTAMRGKLGSTSCFTSKNLSFAQTQSQQLDELS